MGKNITNGIPNSVRWSDRVTPTEEAAKPNAADKVFDVIRQAIITGELYPNQRLVESEIARKLEISRTPVRDALNRLKIQGYVSQLPRRGWIVVPHSKRHIRNLFEVRDALESMAVRLACQRVTQEQLDRAAQYHEQSKEVLHGQDVARLVELNIAFHMELYEGCDNEQLLSLIKTFMDSFLYTRLVRVFTAKDWQRNVITQHGCILQAVEQRNPRRAEKAIHEHMQINMEIALQRL